MVRVPLDVHVWVRPTAAMDDGAVGQALAVLSADERERCGRFRFARDRRDFAAAHALLRTVLSERAGRSGGGRTPSDWRFETVANGKPVLAADTPAPVAFNLTHTRGCVAVALTGGPPVGVDVEALDRKPAIEGLAHRYFGPSEIAWLTGAAGDERRERFFLLWTLKEAYLKATGEGIARSLHAIRFDLSPVGAVDRFTAPPGVDASDWAFNTTQAAPGYVLSVAVETRSKLRLHVSRI
jgi:4'-phosphopantetheinyl transferase